jgi:uncharacterized protein (TIGR03000 family)
MYRMTIWGLRLAALAAVLFLAVEPAAAQRRGGGGGGARVSGGGARVSGGGVRYGGDRGEFRGSRVGIGIGLGGLGYGGYGGYYGSPGYSSYYYPQYSDYYYPQYSGYYSPDYTTTGSMPYYNNGASYYTGPAASTDQTDANAVTVDVHVPQDAQVWFDGNSTTQGGEWRRYVSPPLGTDKSYQYDVRARWTQNGQVVDQTRRIEVRAGQRGLVDFMRQDQQQQAPTKPPM